MVKEMESACTAIECVERANAHADIDINITVEAHSFEGHGMTAVRMKLA